MLKYKFNINQHNTDVEEIICDTLFMSPDMDYISGVTSYKYNLTNGQTIYVRENDNDVYTPFIITTQNKVRQGYVIYPQTYQIQEFTYNDNTYKGIVFGDGKKYIANTDNKIQIDPFVNGEANPSNLIDLTSSDSIITIKTKYYIYDSQIRINGKLFSIDLYDFSTNNDVIDINGKECNIYLFDDVEYVTMFTIRKNLDYRVNVEHISYTKPFKYIFYEPLKLVLYLQQNADLDYYLSDISNSNIIELTNENYNPNQSINFIYLNDNVYEIQTEWRNTNYGDTIHLYLDSNDYFFHSGQVIKVTSPQYEHIYYIESNNNKEYVTINGEQYNVSNNTLQFLEFIDGEYEIFQTTVQEFIDNVGNGTITSKIQYYIVYNNEPLLIDVNGTKATRTINSELLNTISNTSATQKVYYNIKTYKYVEINNIKYLVYDITRPLINSSSGNTTITTSYIFYGDSQPMRLNVLEVTNGNQLRCALINSNISNGDALNGLVNSHENYTFELENLLFDEGVVDNKPNDLKSYKNSTYRIYKPINTITLPLNLSSDIGLNLHQEYICDTQFYEREVGKSINRIIDMEKDIYYPAYLDTNTNKFYNILQIKFLLHFRSRDNDDWILNNTLNPSEDVYTDWNILDYYSSNKNDTTVLKPFFDFNQYPYYQPSDLLGFLNFTNDDVFYQKNKIKKSFLRLSFYDNPDPRQQSLLHTATVFMQEGPLYQTYINNHKKSGSYLGIMKYEDESNIIIKSSISTDSEPVKYNNGSFSEVLPYDLLLDDSKRLSATFTIQDMFSASDSSEGFYLYLFKEYSSGIHEKDIYLKVEFNHAGVGKTITFMQPYKIINGNVEMLNLSNTNDINLLKNGCTLNNLYNFTYIKIHTKYDFENKKFYYYLPEWLCKNDDKSEMVFNLFELKLANES